MTPWRGTATVFGEPQSMGSKRIAYPGAKHQGRPFVIDDRPAALRSWQREMKAAMRETAPPEPLAVAVAVVLVVAVFRPLNHYRVTKAGKELRADAPRVPPAGRDIDKVLRAVLDCGTGIWWRDDKQVAIGSFERRYVNGAGDGARTELTAWAAEAPLPEPPRQERLF